MSLLLIVLLLDISHLELVEDVLRATNFNDKDWRKLRRQLGVHVESQKYGSSGNSLKLKECLRKWLTPITATTTTTRTRRSYHLQTLDSLAAALKSIGYIEAGEYIIKTCKLIIMFNDQCY